jgi:hypothetical protein
MAEVPPAPATLDETRSIAAQERLIEELRTRSSIKRHTTQRAEGYAEYDCVGEYKWSSNDGWLVTPAECTIVADGMTASVDSIVYVAAGDFGSTVGNVRHWVEDWAEFNRVAASHGGYRVR